MDETARRLLVAIAGVEESISARRAELRELQGQLESLRDQLGAAYGAKHPRAVQIDGWRFTINHVPRLTVPTKSADPRGCAAMVAALKGAGVWDQVSSLDYAGIKSGWFGRRGLSEAVRETLRPFVSESEELAVRCKRGGP